MKHISSICHFLAADVFELMFGLRRFCHPVDPVFVPEVGNLCLGGGGSLQGPLRCFKEVCVTGLGGQVGRGHVLWIFLSFALHTDKGHMIVACCFSKEKGKKKESGGERRATRLCVRVQARAARSVLHFQRLDTQTKIFITRLRDTRIFFRWTNFPK